MARQSQVIRVCTVSMFLVFALMFLGCQAHIRPNLSTLIPSPPVPSPPPSNITTNLRVSISTLGPSLNDAVPDTFATDSYCVALGLACVHGFLAREPFRLNLSGSHLILRSMLHYELDGSFLGAITGTCGQPDNTKRRASVNYDSDLTLMPNWKLNVSNDRTQVTSFNNDKCEVTLINRDVTSKAMDALNHVAGGITDRVKQRITESDEIHDLMDKAWNTIAAPISLDSSAYVELHPDSISLRGLAGANETVTAAIIVSAKPVVTIGAAPPSPQHVSVPDYQAGGPVNDQFNVMALVQFPFQTLQEMLSLKVLNKEFVIPAAFSKRKVKIVKVSVNGVGNNLVVGLDLTGDIVGTAWVVGKIDYEPADRLLKIGVIETDLDTKNVLLRAAQWFSPDLLTNAVRSALGDFKYDVGEQADELRQKTFQALNKQVSSSLTLRTDLNQPEVRGPFTDDKNFVFTVSLNGRSEIDVTPEGVPLATGDEIRFVSVYFETSGDDKDAEEPVDLYLYRGAQVLSQRKVGVAERWGDSPPENQGPYFLTVPLTEQITDCHELTLRIFKEPAGSDTGKGWKNVMHARLYLADGSDHAAAHSPFDQWGDGDDHPWDRRFGLCDPSQ